MQSCQDPLKKFQKNPVGKLMEDEILVVSAGGVERLKRYSFFFQTECSKRKFVFNFFKAILGTVSDFRGRFLVKGTGTKFTSLFRQAQEVHSAAYE